MGRVNRVQQLGVGEIVEWGWGMGREGVWGVGADATRGEWGRGNERLLGDGVQDDTKKKYAK